MGMSEFKGEIWKKGLRWAGVTPIHILYTYLLHIFSLFNYHSYLMRIKKGINYSFIPILIV